MTECPDCGQTIYGTRLDFIRHRELEHPPAPLAVSGAGAIRSETRFGTDPDLPNEE